MAIIIEEEGDIFNAPPNSFLLRMATSMSRSRRTLIVPRCMQCTECMGQRCRARVQKEGTSSIFHRSFRPACADRVTVPQSIPRVSSGMQHKATTHAILGGPPEGFSWHVHNHSYRSHLRNKPCARRVLLRCVTNHLGGLWKEYV